MVTQGSKWHCRTGSLYSPSRSRWGDTEHMEYVKWFISICKTPSSATKKEIVQCSSDIVLQDWERKHKQVVAVYRSHLLAAVQVSWKHTHTHQRLQLLLWGSRIGWTINYDLDCDCWICNKERSGTVHHLCLPDGGWNFRRDVRERGLSSLSSYTGAYTLVIGLLIDLLHDFGR